MHADMKKLTIQDLPFLTESDKGLLFNYFGAKSATHLRPKLAFGFALLGCLMIAASYYLDGLLAEMSGIPEWLHSAQWFAKIFIAISIPFAVIGNLVAARSFHKESLNYEKELAARGLDASGLTIDQVFNHVAMPMFRRQGLKIKE